LLIYDLLFAIIEHICSTENAMPKIRRTAEILPTLVVERMVTWGKLIQSLRMTQKMRAADLCERIGITHTTLRRMEHGDPGAAVGLYLAAFMVLGAMDLVAPAIDANFLLQVPADYTPRVRASGSGIPSDF
jgi:DNA-binding XRE family transcriptional regulator